MKITFGGFLFTCLAVPIAAAASTTKSTATPTKQMTAVEAADIGDDVSLQYPASTILCSARRDASVLHMTGRVALVQTLRVENNDVWQVVKDQNAARKNAMRSLYSCSWAPRDMRYRVEHKEISGTKNDPFHVVSFCLQPSGDTSCWWMIEDVTSSSPFKNLQQATDTATSIRKP
jgi:hypothetical protein